MTKLFTLLLALVFTLALVPKAAVHAQENHEYAPIQEKSIGYKDWTYKSLKDDKSINLREWAKDKKLVLVVYFAPWCPNWRYEAPVVARLYEKYKAQGFEVVGISEYGSRDDVKNFFGEKGAPYLVVSESEARDARDKTSHYTYRQASGDTRKWGSPYNIFLEPMKLSKSGDVLTEKAWTVNGELVEAEADKFISTHLLGAITLKAVSPCQ
ncbi:MAG: TlpA family protein disulfide reductase [Pyrinomonadaceae bacterium]|nr:TlpA family protein disulfide reductase [Pyrinomonadaceae bacterium]